MALISRRNNLFFITLLIILFGGIMTPAFAMATDGPHNNAAEARKTNQNRITFQFYLNLPQALHQLMAPQLPFAMFLKIFTSLPEIEFQKNLTKAMVKLTENAFFILPSGVRVNLVNWQLPDARDLKRSFDISLLLLNLPPDKQSHLDPIIVRAESKSAIPQGKVHIQLPDVFYPISVNIEADKFWLSKQSPQGMVNIQ